jgi:hypothetical protein
LFKIFTRYVPGANLDTSTLIRLAAPPLAETDIVLIVAPLADRITKSTFCTELSGTVNETSTCAEAGFGNIVIPAAGALLSDSSELVLTLVACVAALIALFALINTIEVYGCKVISV